MSLVERTRESVVTRHGESSYGEAAQRSSFYLVNSTSFVALFSTETASARVISRSNDRAV